MTYIEAVIDCFTLNRINIFVWEYQYVYIGRHIGLPL